MRVALAIISLPNRKTKISVVSRWCWETAADDSNVVLRQRLMGTISNLDAARARGGHEREAVTPTPPHIGYPSPVSYLRRADRCNITTHTHRAITTITITPLLATGERETSPRPAHGCDNAAACFPKMQQAARRLQGAISRPVVPT